MGVAVTIYIIHPCERIDHQVGSLCGAFPKKLIFVLSLFKLLDIPIEVHTPIAIALQKLIDQYIGIVVVHGKSVWQFSA